MLVGTHIHNGTDSGEMTNNVNRDSNLGYPTFQQHWWPTAPMGFPDGITCIVSPTGNRNWDGRHDGAGGDPLHQKFGFRDNFRFKNFPSNMGDLNLGPPAFSATLVTKNYTNGIASMACDKKKFSHLLTFRLILFAPGNPLLFSRSTGHLQRISEIMQCSWDTSLTLLLQESL